MTSPWAGDDDAGEAVAAGACHVVNNDGLAVRQLKVVANERRALESYNQRRTPAILVDHYAAERQHGDPSLPPSRDRDIAAAAGLIRQDLPPLPLPTAPHGIDARSGCPASFTAAPQAPSA
jgi:hypothetical protein